MADPVIPPTDDLTDEATGRRRDPELLAMERILRQLADLDEPARGRVVRYLRDRFEKETAA